MTIEEFRKRITDLVESGEKITDEEFWVRVGDWSLKTLETRARTKRAMRGEL